MNNESKSRGLCHGVSKLQAVIYSILGCVMIVGLILVINQFAARKNDLSTSTTATSAPSITGLVSDSQAVGPNACACGFFIPTPNPSYASTPTPTQ